jgi:hypothetical protein
LQWRFCAFLNNQQEEIKIKNATKHFFGEVQGAPKKKKIESGVYLADDRWPLNGVGTFLVLF